MTKFGLWLGFAFSIFSLNSFATPVLNGRVNADLPFVQVLPDHQDANQFYINPQTYTVCGEPQKPEFSFSSFVVAKKPKVAIQYNLCPYNEHFAAVEIALKKKFPKAVVNFIPTKSLLAGDGLWDLLFNGKKGHYHCAAVFGSTQGKVACQISTEDESLARRLYLVFADSTIFALNGYFDRVFDAVEYEEGKGFIPQRLNDTVAFGVWGMKEHPELLKVEWKPEN